MMSSVSIFFLWLLGCSEEGGLEWEEISNNFISIRLPTGSVIVGQDATIVCHTNCLRDVLLKINGQFIRPSRTWRRDFYEVRFPNVKREHGGIYTCCCSDDYFLRYHKTLCSKSMELLITVPQLSRPSISLSPSRMAVQGSDVTIQCGPTVQNMDIYLQKAGAGLKPQAMEANGKTSVFYIKNVHPSDEGNYSCWYRGQFEFVVSRPSNTEELRVFEGTPMINAIATGVGITVLVLLMGLGACLWYKKRKVEKRQSTKPVSVKPSFSVMRVHWKTKPGGTSANENGQQKNLPPELDSTTETQEVIYAELKQKAPPVQSEEEDSTDDSDGCVYATLSHAESSISGKHD